MFREVRYCRWDGIPSALKSKDVFTYEYRRMHCPSIIFLMPYTIAATEMDRTHHRKPARQRFYSCSNKQSLRFHLLPLTTTLRYLPRRRYACAERAETRAFEQVHPARSVGR